MTRLRYQTGGLTHSSNIMMEKPAVMRPRYSPWLVSSGRHPRPRSSIRRSARAATMHMLHVISRPESQKTAMMVMTTILSISSSLRGDCRFLCRVISTRAPSDTVTGGVRVCGIMAVLSSSSLFLGKTTVAWCIGNAGPWERRTAGTGVPETVVRVSVVLFRPPVCLEGELGQRLPWRAVTSMRRRFMSSMVQPMPVRATAARSMPFVFAPVDAMT